VLETARLTLRRLAPPDAPFILQLLNDPSFLRYVGDRGVRTEEDARRYIADGPVESYQRFGFGLYLVLLRETGEPAGICGLLKREWLEDVDVGFAFLPRFRSQGFAFEAASAVLAHARDSLGLRRIAAIASADNAHSIALLGKLGFRFERMVRAEDQTDVRLFVSEPDRQKSFLSC
jgi:RimJ/RimL family protein N-acetyltransferase